MRARLVGGMLLGILVATAMVGCSTGKPGNRPETLRPDQQHDFFVLYKQNCSACHGDNGLNGAAIPLHNPVLLDWLGSDRIHQAIQYGVPHTLMPGFGYAGGGLLTGQQVDDIAGGMMKHWSQPSALQGANAPSYTASGKGDPQQGHADFVMYCSRCHGSGGQGIEPGNSQRSRIAVAQSGKVVGSIVDPTYLALISTQGLRDIIVAGLAHEKMPDWRDDVQGKPLTDKEVTDIVAWLDSHRVQYPGQPFSSAHVH